MIDADDETLAFYDREGARYATWSTPAVVDPCLERFLAETPAEGRLLDYGCGGGWAAKRMLDEGRRADAFDGSAALAEEASQLTGINVRVMRFEAFDAASRYVGVWASFCLLHAPRSQMATNLARIGRALVPGGLLYLGLKRGAGEDRDSLGRLYVYYETDEIRDLLAGAGFTAVEIEEKDGAGYDGVAVREMHVFARKPADG